MNRLVGWLPFVASEGDTIPDANQLAEFRQKIDEFRESIKIGSANPPFPLICKNMYTNPTLPPPEIEWEEMRIGLLAERVVFDACLEHGKAKSRCHVLDAVAGTDEACVTAPSPTFDVFLSHNSSDKPTVRELKKLLEERSLAVWLDEDELRPGMPWESLLQAGIRASKSVTVLVGRDGLGPWANEEMQAALRLAVKDGRPVIPVMLPDAGPEPELPLFLSNRTWVDLRRGFLPEGLAKLVWGITGMRAA